MDVSELDVTLPDNRDERYRLALAMFEQDPLDLLAFYQAATAEWRAWADEELWADLLKRRLHWNLPADFPPASVRHMFEAHICGTALVAREESQDFWRAGRISVHLLSRVRVYEVVISARESDKLSGKQNDFIFRLARDLTRFCRATWPAELFFGANQPKLGDRRLSIELAQSDNFDPTEAFIELVFVLLNTYHFRWRAYSGRRALDLFSCISCNASEKSADRVCGGCARAAYCSEACADAHWTSGGHARQCAGQ